jgi:hypothetical protein
MADEAEQPVIKLRSLMTGFPTAASPRFQNQRRGG